MWDKLSENKKEEYKRLILAFASLTEMFAQKADDNDESILSPIINSKFQETVFQKALDAVAEDIGNTSYDASLILEDMDGNVLKYLIGIKTFGIASGAQKVAQFKKNHDEWSSIIDEIKRNSYDENGNVREKEVINQLNAELYQRLARKIAVIRNERISSAEANIRGFNVEESDNNVKSVYHVLMPSPKDVSPKIYVGETSYDKIDIDNITISGCSMKRNPTNFTFSDGKHTYRYTSADSQLLMEFDNNSIVKDEWDVKYAKDAYNIFSSIAAQVYDISQVSETGDKDTRVEKEKVTEEIRKISRPIIKESYSWSLLNDQGEVESFSGFNTFYGVGSKIGLEQRKGVIEKIKNDYEADIEYDALNCIINDLKIFLLTPSNKEAEKGEKVKLRVKIVEEVKATKNKELEKKILKLLYRPLDEMYIPIPNAKKFHLAHPNFFGNCIGTFKNNSNKLALSKEERCFNLIFEPSGSSLQAYITQDCGKAIESYEKQTYLGKWILREIFQLEEYERLTRKKLDQLGINGIRLYKFNDSSDIHLQFIWIDENNLPDDIIVK